MRHVDRAVIDDVTKQIVAILAKSDPERSRRSRESYNESSGEKQSRSLAAVKRVANALGAKFVESPTSPVDVILDGKHGVEIKVMHDLSDSRINMRRDSRENKRKWSRGAQGRTLSTVLVDQRDVFDGGKHKSKYSGHRLYFKPDVGAFRIKQLIKVRNMADLKKLIRRNKTVMRRYGLKA